MTEQERLKTDTIFIVRKRLFILKNAVLILNVEGKSEKPCAKRV